MIEKLVTLTLAFQINQASDWMNMKNNYFRKTIEGGDVLLYYSVFFFFLTSIALKLEILHNLFTFEFIQ